MRDKLLDVKSNEHLLRNKYSIKSSVKSSVDLRKRQSMINDVKATPKHAANSYAHTAKSRSNSHINVVAPINLEDELKALNSNIYIENTTDHKTLKPILNMGHNNADGQRRPTSSAKQKKIKFTDGLPLGKQHFLRATSTHLIRMNSHTLKKHSKNSKTHAQVHHTKVRLLRLI